MDPDRYAHHIGADAAALVSAARAEPEADVPACPGWDRATLVKHVCAPFGWAAVQLEVGPDEKRGFRDAPRPAEDDDVFAFFEAATDRLLAALSAADLEAVYPTWAGPRPGRWFARRMAHEVAVHRYDGAGGAMGAELGVDGVDELLEVFAPLLGAEPFGGIGTTLHLHATDLDTGEWLVRLGPDGLTSERGHHKGDAAVRGAAGDLYLFAWNRVPLDERFEVIGDRAAAERWAEVVCF